MANWDPKYVKRNQAKRSNEVVSNIEWNEIFNLLMAQGNWNAEALYDLINDGNLLVQKAIFSNDSAKLGGNLPEFYAFRDNVLGRDEKNSFTPTLGTHPTNKKYVDDVKEHLESYYFANGITIQGIYTTLNEFLLANLDGEKGDAYVVARELYVWDPRTSAWKSTGPMIGPGVPKNGLDGQLIMKDGPLEFSTKYTPFTEDQLILSESTRNISVSTDVPENPIQGDIWIKI